jgi:alpha-beta hydrolase superfamily lysophospholipase
MKNEVYSWTTFDGLSIHAQMWKPEGPARAVISLVHGFGDHSGRYPSLVEALTSAGYAINAFDRRGEGKSAGPRVYTPSYEALLRDIDQHLANTRERFPRIPHVLYGHSFGGQQVLRYVMERKPALAAVVASSPGLASGIKQPGAKIMAGRLLAKIAPRFQIPLGSPLDSLSHDPAWLETTRTDPLFIKTLSAGIAIEFLKTSEWILSQASFPPLPLLIMQGTTDRHVDPKTNIEFAKRLKGDVTLKVWEGLGHELHNELSRAEVLAFVRGWLDAHVK